MWWPAHGGQLGQKRGGDREQSEFRREAPELLQGLKVGRAGKVCVDTQPKWRDAKAAGQGQGRAQQDGRDRDRPLQ